MTGLDLALSDYALVAAVAFAASIVAGITGYGTGLLLPMVLVPLIGAQAVVPVIGLASLATNLARLVAFRPHVDWRKVWLVSLAALPGTALGAWGYAQLSGRSASLLIGLSLLALVPVRRLLARRKAVLGMPGALAAASGYGVLVGGTPGSGVVLIAILMATGMAPIAVVATDAAISLPVGIVKTGVFLWQGALPAALWVMAAVIGCATAPGAFVARAIAERISARGHALVLDGVVIAGGLFLVAHGTGW